MAKLFKTISLEERYKDSIQGQRLPIPTSVKAKEGASLKLTPNAVEKNSAILKAIIKTPTTQIPSLREFITAPLASLAKPMANTRFRSAISLRDRLSQINLGTTTYLPQFYLSDTYANYIKISPFGLFTHTSNIQITYPNAVGNQGGTDIKAYNPKIAQGSVDLRILNYNSLVLQGTVFSNGVYSSLINTTVPIQNPNQGPGTNPKYTKSSDLIAPLQGLGTNPQPSRKVETLALLQGIIISNNKAQSVINTTPTAPEGAYPVIPLIETTLTKPAGAYTEDPKIRIKLTPKEVSVFIPKSIVIVPTVEEVQQEIPNNTSNILPFGFIPRFTSPTLKLLRYELSRTIAFFSPIVAHGDSGLSDTITKQGTSYFQDKIKNTLSIGGSHPGFKNDILKYLESTDPGLASLIDVRDVVDYTKIGRYKSGSVEFKDQKGSIDKSVGLDNSESAPRSLGSYSTLTYDELVKKGNSQVDLISNDFREELANNRTWSYKGGKKVKYINNKPPSKLIKEKKTTEILSSPITGVPINDFVKLEFGIKVSKRSPADNNNPNGKVISNQNYTTTFKAFLTSFGDSFTNTYSSKKFLNRTTEIKAFEASGRQISLGFKVAAFTQSDLNSLIGRLQTLCQAAAVPGIINGVLVGDSTFTLTLGKWCTKVPVFIDSIKLDVQTADYSWDIEKGLPHIIDVSVSCTVDGAQGANYFAIANSLIG